MAFERLEPFEGWRGDYRNALLLSQIVNTLVSMFGSNKRYKINDFMPDFVGAFLPEEKLEDSSKRASDIFRAMAPKGSIRVWSGMAPPIRRIGRRGKPTARKRRLQEILYGKSGNSSIPDRG